MVRFGWDNVVVEFIYEFDLFVDEWYDVLIILVDEFGLLIVVIIVVYYYGLLRCLFVIVMVAVRVCCSLDEIDGWLPVWVG